MSTQTPGALQMRIDVSIEAIGGHSAFASGQLRVSECVTLGQLSFLESAQLLGRIHELVVQLHHESLKARS